MLVVLLAAVVLFLRSDDELPLLEVAPFARPAAVRVRLASLGPPPWTIAGAPLVVGPRAPVELTGAVTVTANAAMVAVGSLESDHAIELESGDGIVRIGAAGYPGRVVVAPATEPRPVALVELEPYVARVLPREMPLSFPRAALRAQAVCVRSYAVSETHRRRRRSWDLDDTELSQVFGGTAVADARARDIVASVRGVVLAWDGRPLPAFFSSTCGGRTRSAAAAFGGEELAPLSGGPCGYCDWSREFRWRFSVGVKEFRRAAGLRHPLRRVVWEPGDDERGEVWAVTSSGRRRVPTPRLRARLGGRRMRSTWVTGAELRAGRVALVGRGFGHGVGLCQNGARGMADAGYDMTEILAHYYPGATLVELRP